jgi:hypothetical protein
MIDKGSTAKVQQSPTLQSLPTEVHLEIFSYLRDANSACLGVTCRQFYAIHWGLHGKVSLEAKTFNQGRYFALHAGLKSWMGPELEYHPCVNKFLTKERRKTAHTIILRSLRGRRRGSMHSDQHFVDMYRDIFRVRMDVSLTRQALNTLATEIRARMKTSKSDFGEKT